MAPMRRTSRQDTVSRLRKLLDLAESDPARFRAECRAAASRLGVGVEQVYQMLQQDQLVKQKLRDAAALGAARLARRVLGL